jgi:Ca2+/Na+ antiporter
MSERGYFVIIIIVIVIIINGQTALFEPYHTSEDSTKFDRVFSFLDLATIIFFHRARSSALRPTSNLEDQVLYLCPPVTG